MQLHLPEFNEGGNAFLDHIVTGDKTWVYYLTPQSKRVSMSWKCIDEKVPLKFREVPLGEKIMGNIFGTVVEFYWSNTYHRA